VLKFSSTGQFVLQIGKPGDPGDKDSQTQLDRPAAIAVDSAANEVFVADAGTHQRVVVFDATTGAFKRQWRAPATGSAKPFAGLSAIAIGTASGAKTIFVGDRKNNMVYAFKPDGTMVTSVGVRPETKGFGTIWGMTFAGGTLYVADGQNNKIWSLPNGSRVASSWGDGGGWPGRFRTVGSVAVDSKGNLYTGEAYEGKRIQKWIKK
jgi:DNA-binding beta-propeller fold protein YncE